MKIVIRYSESRYLLFRKINYNVILSNSDQLSFFSNILFLNIFRISPGLPNVTDLQADFLPRQVYEINSVYVHED